MLITAHVEIDRVCQAIFQAIFERRLEPNTRLVEAELAKALSSSRSNIRQALLLLEQRKLVQIVPNKGAVIAEPSQQDAAEVFAARRCIELKILDMVFERLKVKDLKKLRSHLKKEKKVREEEQRHTLIYLTGQFHLLLAEIAGNQVFLDFLNQLIARSSLILEKYELQGNNICAGEDHTKLVELIANGDRKKALTLLTRHLETVEQNLNFNPSIKPDDLQDVFASMDLS
jgi:DNA-binding GntR family transcriptional regulator